MNKPNRSAVRRTLMPRHRCEALLEPLETRRLMSTVVVNTAVDALYPPSSGLVSLRNAVTTADSASTPTTITFDPKVFAAAQTIVENGTTLTFSNTNEPITIIGSSAGVTLNANASSRAILINSGTVTISNLTITNGQTSGYDFYGAGINNHGTLTLEGSTMSNCNAADGGAIANYGTATLINDTFTANLGYSPFGGGQDNSAVSNSGTMTVEDCTISGNTSIGGAAGIANSATCAIVNTIVAGNTDASTSAGDASGSFTSYGYNLVGKTDGSSGWNAADFTGTAAKPLSAKLGPLANNGGPTETFLPLSGSPAIGNGLTSFVPKGITTDQRGLARIVNGKVDIGSVEVQAGVTTTLTVTAPAAQTATAGVSKSFSLGSFTETNATGPYTATIAWGDGSGNTTIKLTAAGTIPATAHTFTTSGSKTVTVTVADSASHSSKATFGVTVAAATASLTLTAPAAQTATAGTSASIALGSFKETGATGPYTATVVWGDGTANTTIKLTAAGTIPATAHTFAKAATDTVSVTVTDSAGHTSNKATFTVTVAAVVNDGVISGTVFNDWNGDGKIDEGELGLGDYTVFIDLKGTGKFATGDPIAISAIDGTWSFTGLAAGTYKVMVEPETFAVQTTPKVLTITLKAGGKSTGNLFGEKAPN